MTWNTVELSKGQKDNIELALSVADKSREWACLTNELALYQGNLIDILPEISPSDSKNGGEIESWRGTVVLVTILAIN